MLELLFVDSELQLVPEIMQDDKQIRRIAVERGKRPSELLLDSNFMHSTIEKHFPGKSNRMGRPDIFHILLNVLLDSILNKEGELEVNIHTVEEKFIRINPETRIPKSFNRYVGLMEKLLLKEKIESPDGKLLMNIEDLELQEYLDDGKRNILLTPDGPRLRISEIPFDGRDTRVIIGGFSEGKFRSNFSMVNEKFSIYRDELTIWAVGFECVASYERHLGL